MDNSSLKQYQFTLNRLLKRIEQELSKINDDALTYYLGQVKQYVITQPSIDPKHLEFYTHVFDKECEFLSNDATSDNIETVINIIASTSGKIKTLTLFDN